MERRNTVQREIVLQTVRRLHTHSTADEIYAEVKKDHPSVGRGTVYRNLNILAEEGKILKIEVPGEAEQFDFTVAAHYHVRCVACKKIFDVEMDYLPHLMDSIKDTRGIRFLGYDIAFKGICAACQTNC